MWADNETTEDLLGYKVHADLLIDVIRDDNVLPVTIGVFGDWGSGKSSILKIVQKELAGKEESLKDNTLVLYFNGWVFEGYDDAKAALLESIIEKFQEHKKLGSKIKDQATKLLKSVKWMRVLGLGFKNVVLPTAAAYFTGGASLVPFLAQEFSKIKPAELSKKLTGDSASDFLNDIIKKQDEEDSTLVREFRKDFKEMIDKSGIEKLVVIIDDLDRCTPDRIIENLEAIKLFLNVDNTAFLIGADPRIVRHAIEHRYKPQTETDGNNRIIDDYLEKLIQIPYNLPKLADSEVETYISLLICKKELSEKEFNTVLESFYTYRTKDRYSVYGLASMEKVLTDGDEKKKLSQKIISISALVPIITQTLSGNPRQIKRFLNTLTLRQRLAGVANLTNINPAILTKLMVLEYSELLLFKQLYEWQVAQKGMSREISQLESIVQSGKDSDILKQEIEKTEVLKNWKSDRTINWLKTEPFLNNIDLSDYFWLSRDRVASSIPGTSLIPPIVRQVYEKLNQSSLSDSVSRKIIKEDVIVLSEMELPIFLNFSMQMLIANPTEKRGYDIFHLLIDEKIESAETTYVSGLMALNQKDIPAAIGKSILRYKSSIVINEYLEKKVKKDDSLFYKSIKQSQSKA